MQDATSRHVVGLVVTTGVLKYVCIDLNLYNDGCGSLAYGGSEFKQVMYTTKCTRITGSYTTLTSPLIDLIGQQL